MRRCSWSRARDISASNAARQRCLRRDFAVAAAGWFEANSPCVAKIQFNSRMTMPEIAQNENLREEFNRWAEAGKGESMESEHRPIVEPTLAMMKIGPRDEVLDVGCGGG